jgi:hypothetical protein
MDLKNAMAESMVKPLEPAREFFKNKPENLEDEEDEGDEVT